MWLSEISKPNPESGFSLFWKSIFKIFESKKANGTNGVEQQKVNKFFDLIGNEDIWIPKTATQMKTEATIKCEQDYKKPDPAKSDSHSNYSSSR